MIRQYGVTAGTVDFDDVTRARIAERTLASMTIRLSPPVVIAESEGRCWFPDILKFPTGELMVNYSLNPDSNFSPFTAQAVVISTDGGASWGTEIPPYDVNGFHNSGGEVRGLLADGSLVGPGTSGRPMPEGQWRRFAVHYWRYDQGGRRYSVEPWGSLIEGLPRDVAPFVRTAKNAHAGERHLARDKDPEAPLTSRWWWARFNFFGDAVETAPGRWISTLSLRFGDDTLESTVALVSTDELRTWSYLSTIAGPEDTPDAKEGFDEPCLVRLDDGDLMCVSRVGGSQSLFRCFSSDDGLTWSKPDEMAAWSVAPQILKLENGVLVMSTGRPGTYLWFCEDGRGNAWQSIEVAPGYHNAVTSVEHHIEFGKSADGRQEGLGFQTTSYTAMVEVRPNTVLLVYDRSATGWFEPSEASNADRISRIYGLSVEVDRGR